MRRFDSQCRAMKETILSGAIGAPLVFHSGHRNPSAPAHYTKDMALTDTAAHDIDIARFLLDDEPAAISVKVPRKNIARRPILPCEALAERGRGTTRKRGGGGMPPRNRPRLGSYHFPAISALVRLPHVPFRTSLRPASCFAPPPPAGERKGAGGGDRRQHPHPLPRYRQPPGAGSEHRGRAGRRLCPQARLPPAAAHVPAGGDRSAGAGVPLGRRPGGRSPPRRGAERAGADRRGVACRISATSWTPPRCWSDRAPRPPSTSSTRRSCARRSAPSASCGSAIATAPGQRRGGWSGRSRWLSSTRRACCSAGASCARIFATSAPTGFPRRRCWTFAIRSAAGRCLRNGGRRRRFPPAANDAAGIWVVGLLEFRPPTLTRPPLPSHEGG